MRYTGYAENISLDRERNIIWNNQDSSEIHRYGVNKIKVYILSIFKQKKCKRILFLITCNSVVIYYLWKWSLFTNSISLKAFTNTVLFNVSALTVCLISIWVEQNTLPKSTKFTRNEGLIKNVSGTITSSSEQNHKLFQQTYKGQRSSSFPDDTSLNSNVVIDLNKIISAKRTNLMSISVLGIEKYEVFALFFSSCISLVIGSIIIVDAISRIRDEQPIIYEGQVGLGATLGFVSHFLTIVTHPDATLSHVVCKALPCPTLKGINPIIGGNFISFFILCGVQAILHFWKLHNVDTAAVFAIISLTAASMVPLAFFTAATILQKLSYHMSVQLDKCLRDALFIDGVLEFKNERFWTQSFGKLAGSLEVRIHKGANEHYVLSKVIKRLSQVVSTLSVQEFRDPRFSLMEFPLEYYVSELWENEEINEKTEIRKQENSLEKNINIREILSYRSPSFKFKNNQKFTTLLCKNQDYSRSNKNFLFRNTPINNALLLGSRGDVEDFQSTTRLYTQNQNIKNLLT